MAKMEDQLSAKCARVYEEECPAKAIDAFWDFSQWFLPVGVYVFKGISIFLEALFICSMMAIIPCIEATLLYFAKSFYEYVKKRIDNKLYPQNAQLQQSLEDDSDLGGDISSDDEEEDGGDQNVVSQSCDLLPTSWQLIMAIFRTIKDRIILSLNMHLSLNLNLNFKHRLNKTTTQLMMAPHA